MITLDREVSYAWGRKLTFPRAVFFLNRYIIILQSLAYLLGGLGLLPLSFFVGTILSLYPLPC